MHVETIQRLVDLTDPAANVYLGADHETALERLAAGDVGGLRGIDGQFALVHRDGRCVRMARTIGRPLRYFLAKQVAGPCLVVAERMDEIRDFLASEGLGDQFRPSYTRMVPAHFVVELDLVGCPDPQPRYDRFFAPQRNVLPADVEAIGERYLGTVAAELDRWLDTIPEDAPIGVPFSGGIDSGAVLLLLNHLLLARGQAPTRLKAFTLSVDDRGADAEQAAEFLQRVGLGMLLEVVPVASDELDLGDTIRVVEDYKPLDVQSAMMALALCRGIRERYPDWVHLVDGDGGDENLKDYPIEANPELTIRSVLNNVMLYQEGWGVDAIKHSLVHTGGQSRGHVRSYAPARSLGFRGFSPFALPNVIEVAEGIPFIELTDWDHERLYELKGRIVAAGIRAITGVEMPVFPKRRFQDGAGDDVVRERLPADESRYRDLYRQVVG